MPARKSSHGTIFLIVSSGSPLALIASSLRSTSKKPFCPMTRSLHPPMTACGHRVRFARTWREGFFEVPISLFRRLLDRRNRLLAWHHAGQREKAGLQDGVGARSEPERERDLRGVDDVQLQLLDDDLLLHFARQLVPNFVRAERAVEEDRAALGGCGEHVDLEQIVEFVHADEASRLDEIRRMNGFRTEPQMRDCV